MADVIEPGPTPDDQSSAPRTNKRRLRAAPETIRERSQRLGDKQEAADQKQALKRTGRLASLRYGFLYFPRKIGRAIASLNRFTFFRVLGKILYPPYFRNSWKELRQVSWPDWKTSWKLTYAVIIFSLIFGIIVFGVDFVLDKLFKELIIK